MQTIRLLIINSNQPVRRGLASLFASHHYFTVVAQIDSVTDIEFLRSLQPDVVLYGLPPHDEKSISAISTIKKVCPYSLVTVFSNTDFREHSLVLAAFTAGADGYLKTPILPADLVAALELTCRSDICFFPRAAKDTLVLNLGVSIKKPVEHKDSNSVGAKIANQ